MHACLPHNLAWHPVPAKSLPEANSPQIFPEILAANLSWRWVSSIYLLPVDSLRIPPELRSLKISPELPYLKKLPEIRHLFPFQPLLKYDPTKSPIIRDLLSNPSWNPISSNIALDLRSPPNHSWNTFDPS